MLQQKLFLGWDNLGKALITGASSGIGAAYAKLLAGKGFDLILIARRKDRLQDLADKLQTDYSIRCETISADLSNDDEINRVVELVHHIDHLDILINNAGFATIGNFAAISLEKSMRMFQLHMKAPLQLSHAALQGMLKRKRGAIINVSSLGAFLLTPGNVLYDATKSFLVTFSENLALEVKDKGIKIQALCPGFTRTEFHEVGDFKNFDKSAVPNSLWMMPDEVASLSLKAMEKNKKVVFVPGLKKRLLKWIVLHSSTVRNIMQNKVRERNLKDAGETL
jgi:short-subunit dehydrogenase